MSLLPNILRLALLLLTPLWLSLASQALELRWSLPAPLSGWLNSGRNVDPSLVPPPGWRESTYLTANPDIAAAVRDGTLVSGYAHYVQSGRAENRRGGFPADSAPPPAPSPAPSPAAVQAAPPPAPAPAAAPLPETPPPAALPAASPSPSIKPPAPAAKPAARTLVSRIRTGTSDEGVRIVLDLDLPDRGRTPRVEPSARRPDGSLTVALPDTGWRAPGAGRLPATDLTYRAEETGGSSRLTVKGEGPLALKGVSTLPPEGDRGHRLVIDVAVPKAGKGGKPGRP